MNSLRSPMFIVISCLIWVTACSSPAPESTQSSSSVSIAPSEVSPSPSSTPQSPPVVSLPPSSSKTTAFECVSSGKGWATIARRGERKSTSPLFTWNSTYFGSEWTPERRCDTVSKRLTKVVAENGGRLETLDLTYGIVNVKNGERSGDYTVICVANRENKETCTESNMLVTLSPQNATDPSSVLATMTNFSQGVSGGKSTIRESALGQQFIPLESLVDKILPGY